MEVILSHSYLVHILNGVRFQNSKENKSIIHFEYTHLLFSFIYWNKKLDFSPYCRLRKWFCYVDFGPSDLSRRKGLSRNYRMPNWAKVKAWSVVSVHFGPSGTAETTHLFSHNTVMQNLTFAPIFEDFLWFWRVVQLHQCFSAQLWLQSKNISQG